MARRPSPILAVLALLLCQVLFVSQAHALAGGPIYPGGRISTTGIYSGVMNGLLSNSLGLFSVTIPRTGIGTGTAVVFRNGYFFSGSIQALVDPDSTRLSGTLDLQYSYTYVVAGLFGPITVSVTISASGLVRASVDQTTTRFGRGGLRLNGTAVVTATAPPTDQPITVDPSLLTTISYNIVGFKQQDL